MIRTASRLVTLRRGGGSISRPVLVLTADFSRSWFSASTSSTNQTASDKLFKDGDTNDILKVDDAIDKLFKESQEQIADASSTGDAWFSTATQAVETVVWDPTWYNLSDQAIVAVKTFHDMTNLEYGWSIVGVTVILRLALFPLMVRAQKTTSRMAHLQPELAQIKNRYEALGTPSRQDQLQFSKQMKSLFAKYEVSPFGALAAPLIQLPCFLGMFFGLKKIGSIYPNELASGGMFWFPDLTVPDPLYILPLASAVTFLGLTEMGKDQMLAQDPARGQLFVNVFRVMAIAMIPVCISFESSMLCYWTSNNLLTMTQTGLLKTPSVRKYFGIWDPPKPVPGTEPESLTEAAEKLRKRIMGEAITEKQKMERHNQEIEIKKKARAFQMLRSREKKQGITGNKSS
jgi:YidC/Oxa1 family membrane protein insertase